MPMNNAYPKVSLIVPVYNGERYIDDCMRSVLGQTYPSVEVVVVDDGSTDRTACVLEKYAHNPKVRIVKRANGGLSAARNSGVAAATGDWVVFVDVDDTIHPELIERMLAVPGRDSCDVLIYDWRNVSPSEKDEFVPYGEDVEVVHFESAFDYYMNNALSVSACRSLYKISVVAHHKFFEGVRYEDFDFTMRLLRKLKRGVHVKWAAYNYVQTVGSIIRSPASFEKFRDMVAVLRHVAEDYASVQDRRFNDIRRFRIGDTVKKMILKPLVAAPKETAGFRRDTLRLVGELMRDGVLSIMSLSVHWWPMLIRARLICASCDMFNPDAQAGLPVYWCAGRPNFGDTVTPMLVGFLLKRRIEWSVKWDTRALTIGSVLSFALYKDVRKGLAGRVERVGAAVKRCLRPKVCVCGAGFISDPKDRQLLIRRHTKVYAVRGKLTAQALVNLGELSPGQVVAYGDPGILFDRLWPDIRWTGRSSGIRAFVPHECYWGSPRFEAFRVAHPEIKFIDVRADPREVFSEISKVAEVFSSSLHGLVAADSLGIPCRWVDLEIDGKDDAYRRYKFDDYYTAYGVRRNPVALEDVPTADVGEQIPAAVVNKVKDDLARSFEAMRNDLR